MKYTIFISLLIFNVSLFGQSRGVYVAKDSNIIVAPVDVDEFKEANDIASKSYLDENFLTKEYMPIWGNITGTLSNQTDLQSALNLKATNTDLASLKSYLDENFLTKEYMPVWGNLTGTLSNQTDLQSALNLKATNTDLATLKSEVEDTMVPKSSLSIFIDLYRDGMDDVGGNAHTYNYVYASYYSDCILKVLDPEGNLLYFFSTISYSSDYLQSMHDKGIYDNYAKVYYYPTGRNNNNTNGTTNLRAKTLFPSIAWTTHCIATYEQALSGQSVYNGITSVNDSKIRITAIQIYPSEQFHDIFLNPENTIICNRQSITTAELDGKGTHLFRPALIQYLR